MPLVLFAAETVPPLPYPLWVTTFLVPAAVALVTLAGSLWVVSLTDFYRRLARWEPYAERLWARQVELYEELCVAADEAVPAAYNLAWKRGSKNPDEHELLKDFDEKMQKMGNLSIRANILLSREFNKAYANFAEKYSAFANNAPFVYANPASYPRASADFAAIRPAYLDLLDAARKSLGIKALDDQARKAILGNMKETGEARQANTLLKP